MENNLESLLENLPNDFMENETHKDCDNRFVVLQNEIIKIRNERDKWMDLCIKKSQELSMEQDGFSLGYTKTKNLLLESNP